MSIRNGCAMNRKMGALGAVAVLVLTMGMTGCADLIGGIGSPPEDDGSDGSGGGGGAPGDGVTDDETDIRTTPACIEYCDDMGANCVGDFDQYGPREACILSCNAFPDEGGIEASGNNLACRARFAKAAARAPDEQCATAGPAGVGECGDKCQAWCTLLDAACPSDRAALSDCERSCQELQSVSSLYSFPGEPGDNIECRIYHATAALESEEASRTHCAHARFYPESICGGDTEVGCERYCQNAMGACFGEFAIYDSTEQCLATCAELDEGTAADRGNPTVGCRQYHASAALTGAEFHCPHASPTGHGVCGPDDTDGTGNCQAYCQLYRAACPTQFQGEIGLVAEDCLELCAQQFTTSGAEASADTAYFVATAESDNSLACHTYNAVKALTEAAKNSPNPTEVALLCEKVPIEAACGE